MAAAFGFFSYKASLAVTPTTPEGIPGLQFTGTRSGALAALALLNHADLANEAAPGPIRTGTTAHQSALAGRKQVVESLAYDIGLVATYALLLLTGVARVARRRSAHKDGADLLERFAPWAIGLAVLFNGIQDAGIYAMLKATEPYPALTWLTNVTTVSALLKFTLITYVVIYILVSYLGTDEPGEPIPQEPSGTPPGAVSGTAEVDITVFHTGLDKPLRISGPVKLKKSP